MPPPADISLRAWLNSALPPEPPREEVEMWFEHRAPLRVDRAVLERLLSANPTVGEEDPERTQPVIDLLRAYAESGRPLTFNATWRERQGGRRYSFHARGYSGPVVLAKGGHEKLPHPRALLQGIPRVLRTALRPPEGHVWLNADISQCFPAIVTAVTRDAALQGDVEADMHQRVGDAFAPGRPDARKLGKVLNNALIGGMTAHGLCTELRKYGYAIDEQTAEGYRRWWWARYPSYADWIARFEEFLQARASRGEALRVEAPTGRTFQFSPAQVAGWRHGIRGTWFDAGVRSIVSSFWRSIEGAVLDRALALLHEHRWPAGLRVALPMYDGMLLAVPGELAAEGEAWVRWAIGRALDEAAVKARVKVKVAAGSVSECER